MNARTAEEQDYVKLADLQEYVEGLPEDPIWTSKYPAEATVTKPWTAISGVLSCWSYVGPLRC